MSENDHREARWDDLREEASRLRREWRELDSHVKAFREYEAHSIETVEATIRHEREQSQRALNELFPELELGPDWKRLDPPRDPRPDQHVLLGRYDDYAHLGYALRTGHDLLELHRRLKETTRVLLRRAEASFMGQPDLQRRVQDGAKLAAAGDDIHVVLDVLDWLSGVHAADEATSTVPPKRSVGRPQPYDKQRFGKVLAWARHSAGKTQAELAEIVAVKDEKTVSRWERGIRLPNQQNMPDVEAFIREQPGGKRKLEEARSRR